MTITRETLSRGVIVSKPRVKRQTGAGTQISSGAITSLEPNASLRGTSWYGTPGAVGISARMMRDPHVAMSVAALTGPICAADARFRAASDDPIDTEVADFCEHVFLERLPWVAIAERILRGAIVDGFSLSELTDDFGRVPSARFPHLESPTAIVPTGLHEVPANTVTAWHQAGDDPSRLVAITQRVQGSDAEAMGERRIGAERLVRLSYAQDGANFAGNPPLRRAWASWNFKQAFLKIQAIKHERTGVGQPVATAGAEASEDDLAAAEVALAAMRVNPSGYIVLPKGFTLNWAGVSQSDGSAVEQAIEQCNKDIAFNLAAGYTLLGLTGQSGSYALGQTQQGLHHLFVEYHAQLLASVLNQGSDGWSPVERIVRLNYGPDVGVPWFELRNLPTANWETRLPQIINAANAKLITPDARLEDALRELLQLPPAVASKAGQPEEEIYDA